MWGKLAVLCVMLVVVVGERNGNRPSYHNMVTMGKSGPVCTKVGRRCLANTTCANRRCRCPPGQKGNAEIECVDAHERLCYFAGDPHVVAFGRASARVNLPCRFRAARFVTTNLDSLGQHGKCSMEVYATNTLHDGQYMISSVHMSIGTNDPALQTHTNYEIYKYVDYDVNSSSIYNYQIRLNARDNIFGSSEDKLDGIIINTTYDQFNNFAILALPQCKMRVKYRIFDYRRPLHSPQLPGLTIMADKDAIFFDGYGDYPAAVCGTPKDNRHMYRHRAEQLGLEDPNTAVMFDILNNEPAQDDNVLGRVCTRVFSTFKGSLDQILDLNTCAFLLNDPPVGRCIDRSNSVSKQPIRIFLACLRQRQGSPYRSDCRMLKNAASVCGGHSPSRWASAQGSCLTRNIDELPEEATTLPPVA